MKKEQKEKELKEDISKDISFEEQEAIRKQDYNALIEIYKRKYEQLEDNSELGKYLMTPEVRKFKKHESVFLYDEATKTYRVEKITEINNSTIETKSNIIPIKLIRTIQLDYPKSVISLNLFNKKFVIHLVVLNTDSLIITENLSLLSNATALKVLLKAKEGIGSNFWVRMIVTIALTMLLVYIVFDALFSKTVFQMLGDFVLRPPE